MNLNAAFKWAVVLNAGYVLIEAAAGFASGSLALLADAAHNLADIAGLLMAWGAVIATRQPANGTFTYGYGRATILAALANAMMILVGVGAVMWEAIHRFATPAPVSAGFVMGVAALGIVVNAGTAFLFRAERHEDLNAHGAFLHMMTDAAVSLGVVLGGAVAFFTGWAWVDPMVAIVVSLMVAAATFSLLKSSLRLTLDAVPASVDRDALRDWLEEQAGVQSVHDLHIWALSTTRNALTVHLVMPQGSPSDDFLAKMDSELEARFNIHHATIQIETAGAPCDTHCCSDLQPDKKELS